VLELDNVLIHTEWDRENGWRFKYAVRGSQCLRERPMDGHQYHKTTHKSNFMVEQMKWSLNVASSKTF
jgi:hypothetical protein